MTPSNLISLEDLKPKFQDSPQRYNNWYFTTHFTHKDQDYLLKLAITEGSLLGQSNKLALSYEPLILKEEPDALVLHKPKKDINDHQMEQEINFESDDAKVVVKMGNLTAICKPDVRTIISTDETLGAELTFTPRGPLFHWGNEPGAACQVTEETFVSGIETLSDVKGTVSIRGKEIEIEGRGLFERVWFGQLNFFQIRTMDWMYGHFDELFFYMCHSESVDNQGRPFHFETGEVYLAPDDVLLHSKKFVFKPENWVFVQEARRFVPFTQSVEVETDKGTLNLTAKMAHYPQWIQPPTRRLEQMTVANIPGWWSLFYDAPVTLEGEFKYNDGKTLKLTGGKGINEIQRISPM